jgi:pentatricopeptide repeat protein
VINIIVMHRISSILRLATDNKDVEDLLQIAQQFNCDDHFVYNIILNHYSKQDNIPMALQCFKRMRQRGVVPTVVTYSPLIQLYPDGWLLAVFLALFVCL